jgi:hypothetical protein
MPAARQEPIGDRGTVRDVRSLTHREMIAGHRETGGRRVDDCSMVSVTPDVVKRGSVHIQTTPSRHVRGTNEGSAIAA